MKFIRRHRLISGALALVLLFWGAYWVRWHPRHGTVTFAKQYALTMQTYDGTSIKLSHFKHENLVVHSWASWCSYCGDEMKDLSALQAQYGKKIEVVEINRAESKPDAQLFSNTLALNPAVAVLLDPNDAFYKSIAGFAMPETLFVDDRGEVVFHQRGPMSREDMQSHIDAMLK